MLLCRQIRSSVRYQTLARMSLESRYLRVVRYGASRVALKYMLCVCYVSRPISLGDFHYKGRKSSCQVFSLLFCQIFPSAN